MLIEFGCPWPMMMLNGTWTNAICRSGPVSAGSDFTNSALSDRFCLPAGTGWSDSWITPVRTWLWKFRPTPGRSMSGSTPTAFSSFGSPIPDRSSSFGDSIAPAQTMTSPPVWARWWRLCWRYSTPVQRPSSMIRREASAPVSKVRFGRAERGLEVRAVGREPLAVHDVDVVPAGALHVRAVEVLGPRVAQLETGVDECARGRVRVVESGVGQRQRAAMTGPRAGVVLLVLQLLEIRQAVLVRPAGRAPGGPAVVVRGVTTDVHHDVEVARTTGQLAARFERLPAVQPGLRLAEVLPVDVRPEQGVPDRRVMDVGRDVGPAGFEEEDLRGRILGQPVGHRGAGGAGPDDDVVVVGHGRQPRVWSRNGRNGTLSWKFAM